MRNQSACPAAPHPLPDKSLSDIPSVNWSGRYLKHHRLARKPYPPSASNTYPVMKDVSARLNNAQPVSSAGNSITRGLLVSFNFRVVRPGLGRCRRLLLEDIPDQLFAPAKPRHTNALFLENDVLEVNFHKSA